MNDIIGGGNQLQNLPDLESKLIDEIKKKRFLIVLDNAWCTDGKEWDRLWKPLTYGEEGGAIVVTTRYLTVARAIAHGSAYSEHLLGEMPEEECMEILKRWALVDQTPDRYHLREWQCKQIVKKLKGVPLAADIMGRFLGKHLDDEDTWRNVVTGKGWSKDDEEELVHRVTGLSYRHLPSHLKPCFAYCSIFPKGFIFDKETLVRMWIAQGYIQPGENQLMEHTGKVYFDNLYQMSFFQLRKSDYHGVQYVMHDLVNDFAQKIFPEGRRWIVAGDGEAPEQVRHVSLHLDESDSTVFENLRKYKKLRTLMIYAPDIAAPALDVLGEFKYMRVLVLKCYEISEFPESIGHLKLLRYLDISRTNVKALPELVCNLLNLQVLKLNQSCELPEVTTKLVNLRLLDGAMGHLANLQQLGRLTSLQALGWYHVPKQRGRIKELGSLNNLHGSLHIYDLENLQSKEEALLANLKDKVYLEELQLYWESQRGDNAGGICYSDSQVLEGLCPPPNLKTLLIRDNLGPQPPSWMKEQRQLSCFSLSDVLLLGCPYWECLPSLGQLPLLKVLALFAVNAVKKVGPEFFCVEHSSRGSEDAFRHLTHLCFSAMDQWEGWDYMPVGRVFPSLQVLDLDECPKLTSLSPMLRHMTTLTELKICRCAQLASLEEDGGEWMFPSLRKLEIKSCPNLTSLSPMFRDLSALEFLEIKSCPMLKELATLPSSSQKQQEGNDDHGEGPPSSSLLRLQEFSTDNRCLLMWVLPQKPRSLESLEITNPHHDLICFTEAEEEGWKHLTSLRKLYISDCPELESLPSSMHILPSLHKLYLQDCPKINRLPDGGLPASLRELTIRDCPELESLPSSMHILPSLHKLDLMGCSKINRLPEGGLPASLRQLFLWGCPKLVESCREGGPDHHKIPSKVNIFT